MKKNTKISYKNFINKKYFQKKNSNNFSKIVNNILENVDISKNNFHNLSKKFKFNFKIEEIKKFRKFERIVIIGMGGSILGTKAIYYFFKKKIKKKFIFLDNIN